MPVDAILEPPREGAPASPPPASELSNAAFWDSLPPLDDSDLPPLPPLIDPPDYDAVAPPWHPFPVHLLPPTLARYVDSAARSVNVAPDMVAVPLLAALASAVGNYASFNAKGEWTEPGILWTAVVAPSGDGKSPAQSAALAFIREAQNEAISNYRRARAEARKSGGDIPRRKVLMTNNATLEGLARAIEENPRGILIEREEVAGVFKASNQYKSGRGCDTEDLLSCYDAKPLIATRKGDGSVDVERAAVSITGGIQPGIARRLLAKNDSEFIVNGLAARLLMALPPERNLRLDLPPIDPVARAGAGLVFHRLLSLMPDVPVDASPPPPRILRFDDAARGILDALLVKNDLLKKRLDPDAPLRRVLPKIEGAAIRLAGILHLARWLDPAGIAPVDPEVIDGVSATAGVGIAAWFLREARRVYALFGQTEKADADPNDLAAAVEKFITQHGGIVKVRDIFDRFRHKAGWTTAEETRTWLVENYIAADRARFEKVGKSLRLVMLEPEEPVADEDEEEPLPAASVESSVAIPAANEAADTPTPTAAQNTPPSLPATEPYELEPGLFDYGDARVDIRGVLRKFTATVAALIPAPVASYRLEARTFF